MNYSNLFSRIAVSIIAIPLIILVLWTGKLSFLFFVLALAAIASYELSGLVRAKGASVSKFIFVLRSVFIVANVYFKLISLVSSFIILLAIFFVKELFSKHSKPIANLGGYFFNAIYIGLMFSTFILTRENATYDYEENFYIVLSLFAGVWVCDSAAYFIGSKFGKNKLYTKISPKKSWEGLLGGLLFSFVFFYFYSSYFFNILSLTNTIILALIVGVIGQLGDLCESMLKRDANVKDSSGLIPGHGGVLDRFDSLLFVVPVAYFYLSFILN